MIFDLPRVTLEQAAEIINKIGSNRSLHLCPLLRHNVCDSSAACVLHADRVGGGLS